MPICIECSYPVSHLYTSHSKADLAEGVRLTQCPRCKRFADKYVEHDFVVLFIDLVLIKRQVYRHLLFNRLGRDDNKFNPSIIRLGILLLLFDVYLTWARIEKSSSLASTPLTTAPIPVQYLFFLTLSALATLAHHLTVRFLASFIRKPLQASTTSENNNIGDTGNGIGSSSNNNLCSSSEAPTPVPPPPLRDSSGQQSTGSIPSSSAASKPSRPASSSGSASFPNNGQPPSHGLPPPLPPRRSSTTPVHAHAQPSSPPSPPSPSAISTALLVSSCTKLFPILLVIWGSENGTDTAADLNMGNDASNINHASSSAVTGTILQAVALVSNSPSPLKSITSAATRTLTSTATAAAAAAATSVASTPVATTEPNSLTSSPFSFLHSLLSLTITNTHLVLLNNIEALLILLDCGYVRATTLAVAGQLVRWAVEKGILSLVAVG